MSQRTTTRRSFLKSGLSAGLGAAILSRCAASDLSASGAGGATSGSDGGVSSSSCVLDPTTTKGPYWVDERLNRSDIRSDTTGKASPNPRPGLPLTLELAVSAYASGACTPLQGAQVDIWHCFLRGYQVTDANGIARFTTIYPGWYSGRTVHIHVRSGSSTL
jgi:protocatechuate 3,4-dioxygenase beta subunit